MKKKKLIALGLATMMAMSVAACGDQAATGQDTAADNQSTSAEVSTDENSGAQIVDDGSYEDCTLTFSWWGGDARHAATLEAMKLLKQSIPALM